MQCCLRKHLSLNYPIRVYIIRKTLRIVQREQKIYYRLAVLACCRRCRSAIRDARNSSVSRRKRAAVLAASLAARASTFSGVAERDRDFDD